MPHSTPRPILSDARPQPAPESPKRSAGDRIQFTRNNDAAKRLNGHSATVVALDVAGGTMLVERHQDGQRQQLDMAKLADRHVRPGWVQTIHAAQGATAERVMAHLESFRTNTVDTRATYVAISRARSHAALYTDSRAKLAEALGLRDGAQVEAIDENSRVQSGNMLKHLARDRWDVKPQQRAISLAQLAMLNTIYRTPAVLRIAI